MVVQQLLNFRTSILVFWPYLKVILKEKWLHLFCQSLISFLVFILYLWGSCIAFLAEEDPIILCYLFPSYISKLLFLLWGNWQLCFIVSTDSSLVQRSCLFAFYTWFSTMSPFWNPFLFQNICLSHIFFLKFLWPFYMLRQEIICEYNVQWWRTLS